MYIYIYRPQLFAAKDSVVLKLPIQKFHSAGSSGPCFAACTRSFCNFSMYTFGAVRCGLTLVAKNVEKHGKFPRNTSAVGIKNRKSSN